MMVQQLLEDDALGVPAVFHANLRFYNSNYREQPTSQVRTLVLRSVGRYLVFPDRHRKRVSLVFATHLVYRMTKSETERGSTDE